MPSLPCASVASSHHVADGQPFELRELRAIRRIGGGSCLRVEPASRHNGAAQSDQENQRSHDCLNENDPKTNVTTVLISSIRAHSASVTGITERRDMLTSGNEANARRP